MNKVVLHIGFGKTGSSSLQSYLSLNPVHEKDGRKLLYCGLETDGHVRHGEELRRAASNTPLGYVSSLPDVSKTGNLQRTKAEIGELTQAGFIPIFSQEDWGRRAADFVKTDFLNKVGCSAHVIVYVRPQVEWFNSGWWQWWAWMEKFSKPSDVIDSWGFDFMRWGKQIAEWSVVPGVEKITVRLHPKNTVEDCLAAVGGFRPKAKIEKSNVSLGPMLIKILKRYPELRTPHSSDVDLLLSEFFEFKGDTPWVMDTGFSSRIIENCREDNLFLMDFLDPKSKTIMQEDARWWTEEAYADRRVWEEEELTLQPSEYEEILDKALWKIVAVGQRLGGFAGVSTYSHLIPKESESRALRRERNQWWRFRNKIRKWLRRQVLSQ